MGQVATSALRPKFRIFSFATFQVFVLFFVVFKSSSLKKGAMVGETKDEEVLRTFNHGRDRAHRTGVFRSPFTARRNYGDI